MTPLKTANQNPSYFKEPEYLKQQTTKVVCTLI